MSRPERMPALRPQESAHGAVSRDGIAHRFEGVEVVAAVAPGLELAAQVHGRLRGVLDVVETVRSRLPDVERRSGDGLAIGGQYAAAEGGGLPGIGRGQ